MSHVQKGMLFVISGPSGVGKGTLFNRLLKQDPSCTFSVSYATRAPRPGEVNGRDYHFVSDEIFDGMVTKGGFLEYATVHQHRYGTPLSPVLDALRQGKNMVLDIDTQGALRVMSAMPDCVSVFILPPSFAKLRSRLLARHTETPQEVERRMRNAYGEVAQMTRYNYLIVNDDLEAAYAQLTCILNAEKQRATRFFPCIPDE